MVLFENMSQKVIEASWKRLNIFSCQIAELSSLPNLQLFVRHQGSVANDEVENVEQIGEVNHAYETLLKNKENNDDKYMERGMQTFNPMMKPLPGVRATAEVKQKIQTDRITFAEAGSQVSDYLLENINEAGLEFHF